MPRIRCHYIDCVFLDQGYCSAAAVEIDPDEGCMTYAAAGEVVPDDAWEENEALEEEWAEAGFTPESDEDDDDLWLEDDPDEGDGDFDEDDVGLDEED